ncbi:asparaginase [Halobacteriales archaeon QS_4_66_20]|nr:MAG: asparaginase [Halobacteriales archaeon QS_4_66_20]
MQLLAHGGAGGDPDDPETRQQQLDRAVQAGADADDPEAAVLATVHELEASPRFNAGSGSAVQSDGVIRTDAGLMREDGTTGAACSMPGVEHAGDVARVVAHETPHVLLAGENAIALAEAFDVATDGDLWSEQQRQRWAELDPPDTDDRGEHLRWVREQFGGTDTVGAVAVEGNRLAALTSTGGRWCALAGRVGDVPQVGAGFYASEHAAVSATGAGEAIARFGLSRWVDDTIADGADPATACERGMTAFEEATGDTAGVIAVDREGRTGGAFNSDSMQTGSSR